MTKLRSAGATDVGMVRPNNEDQMLIADNLFAVADGMGGHAAGEVAALTAVETLKAAFRSDRTVTGLVSAVLRANRAVWERGLQNKELRGMGTTLCAAALVEEDGEELLAIVNVGDSRAYRLQDGEIEQLTEDHSLINELVRDGQLSADEAAVHPQRHVLSRALGVESDVEVDCIQLISYRGDRVLLCSDGLTRELSDDQIASVLRRIADTREAVKQLVAQAKTNGGNDNITVVLIDVVDDDELAETASAALAQDPAPPKRPAESESAVVVSAEGEGNGAVSIAPPVAVEPVVPPVPHRPLLTLRVVLFIVVLVGIIGVAAVALGVYARASYFVGLDGQRVAVFKGRPGQLLWFKPTVDHETGHVVADLLPQAQEQVRANKLEPSRSAADGYVVRNLTPAPTTTTTSTTTTSPAVTTTTAPSPPTSA